MLNVIFKVLKVLVNKNNDGNASLKINTFNLLNTIFYLNTIVKINICHIKVTQSLNKFVISLKLSDCQDHVISDVSRNALIS